MKVHKLFMIVATGGLLVGASGAAMAQTVDDCADGIIVGESVDGIAFDARACHIEDVLVNGNVTITNSPAIEMLDVEVKGGVSVTGGGGRTTLTRVDAFGGNIDLSGLGFVTVIGNITQRGGEAADSGNLTINNNASAFVQANVVAGNLTCSGNTTLREFFNRVFGEENCPPPAAQ